MLHSKGLGGFVSNPSTDRKSATSAFSCICGAKVTQYAQALEENMILWQKLKELLNKLLQLQWLLFLVELSQILQFLEDVNLNDIAKTAQKMASSYKELKIIIFVRNTFQGISEFYLIFTFNIKFTDTFLLISLFIFSHKQDMYLFLSFLDIFALKFTLKLK